MVRKVAFGVGFGVLLILSVEVLYLLTQILCLAAGRGAAAVRGGPAGFTLAPFPPIVNATVAAAT